MSSWDEINERMRLGWELEALAADMELLDVAKVMRYNELVEKERKDDEPQTSWD